MTVPMRLEAPAKLNVSLRVTGRRDDRYHELESELVLIELADRLLLMPGCSGLRVDGDAAANVPVDVTNLAWRGLVAGAGSEPDLACLTLEKWIPSAAGLGGGSSDAAAAWRLGRAWSGLPEADGDEVSRLAAIGADVPFFAAGIPRGWVTGIGEKVSPIPPGPSQSVVLVHPPFRLETAAVFAELRPAEWGAAENDLLAAARRLAPALDDLMALVVAAGGAPRMTGSGPTIFSMTDDPERAQSIAGRLRRAGLRVSVTRTRSAAASIERISEEEP